MKPSIPFLFLSIGFMMLFMNCKDQGTTPPEVTTPVISGIKLSSEQIIVNDSVLITIMLNEELGDEYALKWKLSGYQTDIDSLTSDVVFSWKAPKVHGSYEHSVQIVSTTGEPISEAHPFSTEISSVPVVPLEGNKLVFSMPDGDGNNQIFTMNVDGTALTQLTFFEGDKSTEPSWSPDGRKIVFSTSFESSTAGPILYIMDADGEDIKPLKTRFIVPGTLLGYDGNFSKWSPDGTKIVYSAYLANPEIMVYDFEMDEISRLTNHIDTDSQPSWSPDSKQVIFISGRDYDTHDSLKRRSDLYQLNINDDSIQRLTEIGYTYNPVWRPGSKDVVFRDFKTLKIVNVETREVKSADVYFQKELILYPKSWSMDGSSLLIEVADYPESTFYIWDLDTEEVTQIPLESNEFRGIDWYQYEKE